MRALALWLHLAPVIFISACIPAEKNQKFNVKASAQWQFESFSCAFGCDSTLDEILQAEIGKKLDFNNPGVGFSLFTECNGKLALKEKRDSSSDVIGQLNQTISPEQQFTPANTGLTDEQLTTAQAICLEGEKMSTTFWVVNLTEEKMTVYYEGASFLNFTALK